MKGTEIVVIKLGGSVLRNEGDLPKAVQEIYRHLRGGKKVLAVVSAFNGKTDELLGIASSYGEDLPAEAVATLLATGEATTASLLTLSLMRAGIPAKLLSPEQVGIRTVGDPLNAEPVAADADRIRRELSAAVVVVSGFAGIAEDGSPTLLGRGGTDLTALFLALNLNADCVLIKDVDGLYETDPAADPDARRFARASYETTIARGGPLVQEKAVRFAQLTGQQFTVSAFCRTGSTQVADHRDHIVEPFSDEGRRLRVALLGCGTVGGGVYERLASMPELFEITGVVNLDKEKAASNGIDPELLVSDAQELIERECDIVIELIGGLSPARDHILHALRRGRHVITANKALLASERHSLNRAARESGVTIKYSASVGGALPALEIAEIAARLYKPRSVSGIINGTCNFIIDQLSEGVGFDSAVKLAQAAGFAEADPTLDIDGTDSAQKLILLTETAFGETLHLDQISRNGVDSLDVSAVRIAAKKGQSYRLVATTRRTSKGVSASVRPIAFDSSHPFAQTKGPDNCLLFETESGETHIVKGRGAGRYATTEAVVADLFDISRICRTSPPSRPAQAAGGAV